MSIVKSFNINGLDSSINLASETENGLMSYDNYNNIIELNQKSNLLTFFNFGIDSENGVLRIGDKAYKLIEYEGTASFDEYIDPSSFIDSVSTIDNAEFSELIVDNEEKVLYGLRTDSTEADIDLAGLSLINPLTNNEVSLQSVINRILEING